MITKYHSNAQKLGKFLFLLGAVVSLSCCTSSNKVVSSFSKRKYVKGHFSDPVAKQKTEPAPSYSANAVAAAKSQLQKAVAVENTILAKITKSTGSANFSIPAKTASDKSTPVKFNGISIAKTGTITNITNNVSLKQNSAIQEYIGYGNGGAHNGGGRTRSYLVDCIICLIIWLILAILNGVTGLSILGLLSWIAAIAAVIFFILWVFSLSM